MHIDEIIEERCFGSSNKTVYVCWTSRPIWAWEGQLGLAVTMQDAGVSGAGQDYSGLSLFGALKNGALWKVVP